MTWVTRVPLSISEAKEIVISLYSEEFSKSKLPGYSWQEIENNYAGIKQRWLVVESQTRKESDIIKLEEKISKEEQLISKKLANLSKKDLDSELSANFSLKQVSAKLKYHRLSQDKIIEKVRIQVERIDKQADYAKVTV